jgi:hypothetical protein
VFRGPHSGQIHGRFIGPLRKWAICLSTQGNYLISNKTKVEKSDSQFPRWDLTLLLLFRWTFWSYAGLEIITAVIAIRRAEIMAMVTKQQTSSFIPPLLQGVQSSTGVHNPPTQSVPWAVSSGLKRPGHEAATHLHLLQRLTELELYFDLPLSWRSKSYPRNRPWRPIGLGDVKDPTLSRQSAHRWR